MSYRLSLADAVPKTLRVTAEELLDDAVGHARDGLAEDPVDSVHEIRKDLKKARSLLRLVRPGMPAKAYRRENRRLRDIGRSVAGVRDADVLAETVDKLAERYAGRLPKRGFTTLRNALVKQARGSARLGDGAGLVAALEQARAQLPAWPLDGCDRATLSAGAVRAYARGRAAMEAAAHDPSDERLHEWRKRVKDLWYHQRLLRDAWSAPLQAAADESHRLSDLLGDDHDLAVLSERLAGSPPSAAVDMATIVTLIGTRRAELRDRALQLGRRVYAETPKAYGRRLARYLAASGAEQTTVA
jgi:CHAD domain-containing protein